MLEAGRGAGEAAVLERLRAAADGALARALPAPIAHDPDAEVLVLAAARGARDLTRHHARGRFSRVLAGEAGRALALLHAVPPEALDGLSPIPPAVAPHRPDLVTLRTLSGAAVELTRIVQRSADLCCRLDTLHPSRRRPVSHPRRRPLGQPRRPPRRPTLEPATAHRLGALRRRGPGRRRGGVHRRVPARVAAVDPGRRSPRRGAHGGPRAGAPGSHAARPACLLERLCPAPPRA